LVYSTVRGVTRLAGGGWKAVGTLLPEAGAKLDPRREAWVAAINGVWGEHLPPPATRWRSPMQLRHDGKPLTLEAEGAARDLR
jgi:hypothetical protein